MKCFLLSLLRPVPLLKRVLGLRQSNFVNVNQKSLGIHGPGDLNVFSRKPSCLLLIIKRVYGSVALLAKDKLPVPVRDPSRKCPNVQMQSAGQ